MLYVVIGWLVTNVAAFVAGMLVYRNNAKTFEAKAAAAEKELSDLKAKLPK